MYPMGTPDPRPTETLQYGASPMRSTLLSLAIALAAAAQAAAQSQQAARTAPPAEARRVAGAVRYTGTAPKLDGVLDDDAWAQAQPITDFVQRKPNPGAPATLRTEARILYDDAAVWVAVRAFDPHPDSMVAPV